MAERESFITTRVIAVYPKISTPEAVEDGPPRYSTKFRFEDEAETEKLQEYLTKKAAELMPKIKKAKLPFKEGVIKEEPTGEIWFRASSKYKPLIVDSKNRKLPDGIKIGGGSVLRLGLSLNPFEKNKLLSLYLNQVQVIKLVEYTGGNQTSNFDEIEDGYEADTAEEQVGDFSAEEATDDVL